MRHDPDSTLIRRGRSAVTFTDMAAWVKSLEERPVGALLEELPDLARLSETKFLLAVQTLRRRFRGEAPADQLQLREFAREIAVTIEEPVVAERIREIFPLEIA